MKKIIYLFVLFMFYYIDKNLDDKIINIYKNPIFKLIFLFGLYYYSEYDKYLTILLGIYYIYLNQKIKEVELMENI